MHLVERAKNLMIQTGAEWVLWLLVALSIASIAVIMERALAMRGLRADMGLMRLALRDSLRDGGFAKARVVMAAYAHPGAPVVMRGMADGEAETTAERADDAMASEAIAQRRVLDKRLGFLATLGANAPFIGLFGTVIGILQAFDRLGNAAATAQSAVAPQAVMSSIAEALVATAVGIGVAIPAVFAFNTIQRHLAGTFDDVRVLQLEVLSYLSGPRADGSEQRSGGAPDLPRPSRPASESGRYAA